MDVPTASPLTTEEFENGYAERSGMAVDRLREWSRVVPCDCDWQDCEGWGMVSLDSDWCGECGHYDFKGELHPPLSHETAGHGQGEQSLDIRCIRVEGVRYKGL